MKKIDVKNNIFSFEKIIRNLSFKQMALIVSTLLIFYAGYAYYRSTNPVRSELSQIQKIATDYKKTRGTFGNIPPNFKKVNCFTGQTFVTVPEMSAVMTSPDVENISCVFKVASATQIVEAWSVTIVKGTKAFCEDSTGDRRETPGLTTKETCKAE